MPRTRPNKIDRIIGKRIRQRRSDWKITQKQLGRAVGVSRQQIRKYEKAKHKISASLLWEVAYQLQVPLSYFTAPSRHIRATCSEMLKT